ncbi:MAG: RCC1 domain-containing protein [Phycisphaerales bacterium]|nr:RCC1 domain-containing protein [Phycisphaerales bacterium]
MFKSHAVFVVGATLASISVSAASQDACQDINAWDCGSGAYVQIPSQLDDIVAIDAGDIFSVALRSTGQVVVWGDPPPDGV